jgi:histidinol-phosphate phosphatase family protein
MHDQGLIPAVFIDKDGTLIDDVPYNVDPDLIRLSRGAGEGAAQLAESGYAIVVVSNQSGIARGLFDESELFAVERRLRELLAEWYVPLAGFFYCPHHPEGEVSRYCQVCECRKPAPGLLQQAADELGLDLARSWMVGDILDDVEAGHRAGCRTVLLDVGHETQWQWSERRRPDFLAADMGWAARIILANARALELEAAR